MEVKWGQVPCLERNGEITGYVARAIAVGKVVARALDDEKVVASTNVGLTDTATLTGLSPLETYAVSVAAITDQGTGPYSSPVHVTTPQTGTQNDN